MTPTRGRFVTLEGGEGAGKSTQLVRLKARLEAEGHEVVATREPGGSTRAEAIRRFVLAGHALRHGPFAELLLFAAARADHVERLIRPALARGAFVLCDRFIDSTRVYQGRLGTLGDASVAALERVAIGPTRPDLTLVLDVPAKLGAVRAGQRRELTGAALDRFEREGLAFHTSVRDGFLAIAREEPERCAVVDASRGPDVVEREIWAELSGRLLSAAPAL